MFVGHISPTVLSNQGPDRLCFLTLTPRLPRRPRRPRNLSIDPFRHVNLMPSDVHQPHKIRMCNFFRTAKLDLFLYIIKCSRKVLFTY
jgi:hypothetical protein